MKNNLKRYRLEAGLTQEQVADKLGLKCEDRISHWERGQSVPTVKNLFGLAKIYKVLPTEIYPDWF